MSKSSPSKNDELSDVSVNAIMSKSHVKVEVKNLDVLVRRPRTFW